MERAVRILHNRWGELLSPARSRLASRGAVVTTLMSTHNFIIDNSRTVLREPVIVGETLEQLTLSAEQGASQGAVGGTRESTMCPRRVHLTERLAEAG